MDGALGLQSLYILKQTSINDVDTARSFGNGHINPASIGSNGDVIGMAAQRDVIGHFQCLGVDNVQSALRLIADVDPTAVRRHGRAMVHFDSFDHADNLIGGGIDDVNVIAGAIGLDNPNHLIPSGAQGQRAQNYAAQNRPPPTKHLFPHHRRLPKVSRSAALLAEHPVLQDLPFRIVLRIEMFSAIVKEVAAGLFRQGMYQQRALQIARYHQPQGGREILARVLVVPGAVSRRKRLQSKYLRGSGAPVTSNAASVATTLGHKDRLYFSLEELKIKLCGFAGGLLGPSSRRCTQQASQQSPAKNRRSEKAVHLRLPQKILSNFT